MNKLLSVLLVALPLFSSCEEGKVTAPVIELKSIFINGDSITNYRDSIDKIPALKAGDEIKLNLFLNGNGSFLNSLNITSNSSNVAVMLVPKTDGSIAEDKNFTDLNNGRMSFVDGVTAYDVESKLYVLSVSGGRVKLSYHLSARAECEGGGVLDLDLKTAN